MTANEVKDQLTVDAVSKRKGIFTARKGFFYSMGMTSKDLESHVLEAFPEAKILKSGRVDKPFRGGASVARNSHFFATFTL